MIQIVLIIIAITCILFGILIFINNPLKPMNLLAAGINFFLSFGTLSYVLLTGASTSESALLYIKTGYAASIIVATLMTIFVFIFPKGERLPRLVSTIILLSSALLVGLLLLLPGFVIESAVITTDGSYCSVVDPPSYVIYCLCLGFFFSFATVVLVQKFIISSARYKVQIGTYLFGISALAVPSLVTNLVMPYFQDCQLLWVGPLMTSVFAVLMSYNIIRRGLFDIRLAAVRTFAYALSLIVLAITYFVLATVVSNLFFNNNFSISQNPLSLGLALVMLIIFQPVKKFFDRLTDKIFYRHDINIDEFFARFNGLLTSTTYLHNLLERASKEIANSFKSKQVFFYVYTRDNGHTSAGTSHYQQLSQEDIDRLQDAYGKRTEVITTLLLDDEDSIRLFMVNHHIELIVPLVQSDVIGYLFLGEHQTSNYSPRDIRVIATAANELVIAIQNTLSIQEVRDVNTANLQQKIDSATKELRTSNESLRKMDEEKNEFVSVTSHELRTPLSVIRGYVDLLKREQIGTLNDEQKKILVKIGNSDKALINLVNDMLDLSKLEANQLEVNMSSNSLDDLINQSIEQVQLLYKEKGVALNYKGSNAQVNTDIKQFGHVISNLLSNAYKFTPAGGSVDIKSTIDTKKHLATILIADTGVGISATDIPGIFRKFSQADDYLHRQSGGTGLGLSISKALVEKLGGTIWVESTVGIGSKFYFTIPLA